jgi:hypothetical protein
MTSGISSNDWVNNSELFINPELNEKPMGIPFSLTEFAYKSFTELRENSRAVLNAVAPILPASLSVSVGALGALVFKGIIPTNLYTGASIVMGSLVCIGIFINPKLIKANQVLGNKVGTVAKNHLLKREFLNTNPAKLDNKVFKEAIEHGEVPNKFIDVISLQTIETPVAFSNDTTATIFDLDMLNEYKMNAKEVTHPMTRAPLDFSKLVYLPNVKTQIEEIKKHVEEIKKHVKETF